MFYVYEWYNTETEEIFYVGKGHKNRYKVRKHNAFFNDYIKRYHCDSRIIKTFEKEEDAFFYEKVRIDELTAIGQCVCNVYNGGYGGETKTWTEEKRRKYSEFNVMKSEVQRKRMSINNPMKNKDVVNKVKKKLQRPVLIDGIEYETSLIASKKFGVCQDTVIKWLKKGFTSSGKTCVYKDGKPIRSQVIINKSREKNVSSIPVYVDELWFESMTKASEYLNTTVTYLSKVLRKRNGVIKKHKCRYGNQQPS